MESFQVEQPPAEQPSWAERILGRLRQMTEAECRYFTIICILSLFLAIVLISLVVLVITGLGYYCVSKECIRTAAQIMSSMNSSADPCTDFYEFACGGWQGTGGDEEDNWSLRMLKDTTRQAAELLSKNDRKGDFKAVKKARSIYHSCMATDKLDKLGLEPLLELLERAGLPRGIPNKKTAADFDLSRTIARVQRTLGKPVLIDVLRESDETFTVWMPPLGIFDPPNVAVLEAIDAWVNARNTSSTEQETNTTSKTDWPGFIKTMNHLTTKMKALGSRRFADASASAFEYRPRYEDFFTFDSTQIKRMRLPASRVTTLLYNGTVPNNASNTLYYEVYMDTLLEGRPEVNWTQNRGTLRLADPEYHAFLVSALRDYSPVNIQMLIWTEVIKHFGVHTTTRLRQKMKSRLAAMKSESPRSESCAELVINLMPVVVDHLMAQKNPMTKITEQVKAMTKEIKISQRELVQEAEWLGPLGKRNILQHLDTVKVSRVGYLDWVREGRGIDLFFKDVTIHEGQLLRTIADIQVWQAETNLLVSPLVGRLRSDHVMASAYYYRSMNSITVRPMIMRFPFFPLGLEALNYGAMGLVLGHELGHALDAEAFTGNRYFYLENDARAKVEDFIDCTKERILKFAEELNVKADPEQSINEDVSDITAIRNALYTFHKVRRGSKQRLPGLENFTHDQLFFLAFANVWCTNGKPPGPDAEDGPHNTNRFRILSAASNTPEFAKIWNCPANTRMNPKNKCTLW